MHFDLPLPPVASAGLMMLSMVEMDAAPGPLGILSCWLWFGGLKVCLFLGGWLPTAGIGVMMSADGPFKCRLPRHQCVWGGESGSTAREMAYTARIMLWVGLRCCWEEALTIVVFLVLSVDVCCLLGKVGG